MEFNSGMLGVAIVVLGLIASCLFGVVMNVNQEDVQGEEDRYVSDISGLYSNSAVEQTYTAYTPAKNLNGYTSSNHSTYAVDFTKMVGTSGNNYAFEYNSFAPVTEQKNMQSNSHTSTVTRYPASIFFGYDNNSAKTPGDYDYYYVYARLSSGLGSGFPPVSAYQKPMLCLPLNDLYDQLVSESPPDRGGASISFEIPYRITKIDWGMYDSPHNLSTSVSLNTVDSGLFIAPDGYATESGDSFGSRFYSYSLLDQSGGNGNTLIYKCTFTDNGLKFNMIAYSPTFPSFGTINVISNGSTANYSLFGTWWELNHYGQYEEIMNGDQIADEYQTEFKTNYGGSLDYKVTYTYEKESAFLDPRYGVSVRDNENVIWSNDYINGSLDITAYLGAIRRTSTNPAVDIAGLNTSKAIEWHLFDDATPTPSYNILRLEHVANGDTKLIVKYRDATDPNNITFATYREINLGSNWIAYNIHIDSINGSITVQAIPSDTWNSFTDWTSTQPIIDAGSFFEKTLVSETVDGVTYTREEMNVQKAPISKIQIISPYEGITHSIAMQISNTAVYLNTHGVIMIDPHIDILNWYPNNTHFKMIFTKIASIGPQITIGGTTYDVVQNEMGTYEYIDGERTWISTGVSLSEFSIEYLFDESSNTYTITVYSLENKKEIELESNITEVKMKGAWYFDCGYYTVENVTKKEYSWDVGEGIAYGYTGVILFMMIFVGVISVLWWKIAPGSFSLLDIAIIIITEVILFIIMG